MSDTPEPQPLPDEPSPVPEGEGRDARGVRWQRLFSQSTDPVFVLNRQQRVLFVNAAWEQLTGLALRQVQGRGCRPTTSVPTGGPETLLALLAPPGEVLAGQPATVRRQAPLTAPQLWEISFFPLRQDGQFRGLVGKVLPLATTAPTGLAPLPNKLLALRDRFLSWHRLDSIDDRAPAPRRLREQIRLAGQMLDPVWISGEAGTGKQWVARTIHGLSQARERCFAALDCRRLPATILEQTLFGPCGLTGTAGTIYLKEPQHLSKDLQMRLCQWLTATPAHGEAGPRSRLLAGSCLDLADGAANSGLLEEFRCAVTLLTIPLSPLRERREEWPALLERLLRRAASVTGGKVTGLAPEAGDYLRAAPWPGNVRELFLVLRQACGRAREPILQATDLPFYLRDTVEPAPRPLPLDALLEQVERRLVLLALQWAKDNKSRAAEILGIWRGRLIRRLKDLGIEEKEEG